MAGLLFTQREILMLTQHDGETANRHAFRDYGDTDPMEAIDAVRRALNGALVGKEQVTEFVLACLLGPRALVIRRPARPGENDTRQGPGPRDRRRFRGCNARRTCFPGDITGFNIFNQKLREFELWPAPSSPTSCWPTRSTAPRRGREAPCSRRWRSAK